MISIIINCIFKVKSKITGTGLGLHICYQIIQEHNGKIEVSSKLDKGTTFTIHFPCIEYDDEYNEFDDTESIV